MVREAAARPGGGGGRRLHVDGRVPVTVEDARHILAGDRPAAVAPEDAALVQGYRDAMGFVLLRADDAAFRWDPELIVGLHDRVLAGNRAAGAGRFRDGPVYVVGGDDARVGFEPTPADKVPRLVDEVCAAMQSGHPHAAFGAAWVHVADVDADITDFVRNHLTAQVSQVRAFDLRERVERSVWLPIEQAVDDAGLQARLTNRRGTPSSSVT